MNATRHGPGPRRCLALRPPPSTRPIRWTSGCSRLRLRPRGHGPQPDPVQRFGELGDRAIHVLPLLEAEEAYPERHEIGALIALKRNAGGGLQAFGQEFPARL